MSTGREMAPAGRPAFQAEDGTIAVVQASGSDYPPVLAEALRDPDIDDEEGDPLVVDSGEIAMVSAAGDGAGPYAAPLVLVRGRPGPPPAIHRRPSDEADPGLLLATEHTTFTLRVRWYTQLDEENCFGRWLLLPTRADELR